MTNQPLRASFRPAAPLASLLPLPSLRLLGLDVVSASVTTTLDWLCDRLEAGAPTRVAFLNAHCANIAARDPAYREAIAGVDALLPDGSGVAVAARMAGEKLAANLNGTDLVPALCERLAAAGRSVFLLGARPGVAEAAAERLKAMYPALIIAGTADGYFDPAREAEVVASVNNSGADVLLTALGVPAQDVFLARHAAALRPRLCLGVGALFDFLAERVSRAPAWLRRSGFEWCWRLAQEPRRLAGRYLAGNPAFLARAALAAATPALARADAAGKRGMDILGAAAGLVLLSPVILAAMAAVRLTSRGPALFHQTRIGLNGQAFQVLKLRSMYIDAEQRRAALLATNVHGAGGVTFKLKQDPRVTPVGRFLRKSSIDELPQLWNVLKGEMSLVGPRPQLAAEVARYTPAQTRRLAVKPGITCLWQISGRADLPFERQVALDVEYIATRSLMKDLRILLMTVPAVLAARGAY